MAIAIDASTPAATSQTNGATATVASGSFSPPAGSVLLVAWQGNSAVAAPAAPSISNTGGLTFTLVGWRNKADASGTITGREGQAALWYTVVASAPGSMTVTVTNGAGSGDRQARLKPIVLTGVDTSTPIASSGENSDNGGALDNLSYVSTVANSWGFASVSDWDTASSTFTAGSGTTIVDSAQVGASINCATLRQSTPTTSGSTVTMGLTSPTSTTWNYVWAEMRPASGGSPTNASAENVAFTPAAQNPAGGVGPGAGNAAVAAAAQNARGLPGRPMDSQLVDNFNDNVVDTSIWTANYGGATETGGRARVPCTTGYAAYCTSDVWRLAESSLYARIYPPADNGASTEAWTQMLITSPVAGTDCGVEINAASGLIMFYVRVGYSDAGIVSIAYNSTNHAWARVRETAGTLYWDTSADGLSWTNQRSTAAPAWVDDGNLQVQLIAHRGDGTDDYAEFDNVNVNPGIANVAAVAAEFTAAGQDPAGGVGPAASTATAATAAQDATVTASGNAAATVAGFGAAGSDATITASGNALASAADVAAAGQNPAGGVGPAASTATAATAAQDATVNTSAAANAVAEVAGFAAAGNDGGGTVSAPAGTATLGGAGHDATAATAVAAAATVAGVAAAGQNPAGGVGPAAAAATFTTAGQNAAITASGNAVAEVAGWTAEALFDTTGGSISTQLTADNPIELTMSALDATVSTAALTQAAATVAGFGAAAADPGAAVGPAAGAATLGVAGHDATVSTSVETNASATVAGFGAVGNDGGATVSAQAGAATVSAAGADPAGAVAAQAGAAGVAVAGHDPALSVSSNAAAQVAAVAVAGQDAVAVAGSFVNAAAQTASTTLAGVDAAASTSDRVDAQAQTASTTLVGADPSVAVAGSAVAAAAAVAAVDAGVQAGADWSATAEAAGFGMAGIDPAVLVEIQALAEVAGFGVDAYDPGTDGATPSPIAAAHTITMRVPVQQIRMRTPGRQIERTGVAGTVRRTG